MTASDQKDGFIHRVNSILPFLPEEQTATKLAKDNSVTLELRSIPADNNSPKGIVTGTETLREIIRWWNDLENQVFPGLGLNEPTSGPGQQAILKTLTSGNTFNIVKTRSETLALILRTARATDADPITTATAHTDIMATPVTHADNMTPEMVRHALRNVIELMMPRNALQKVATILATRVSQTRWQAST